MDTCFILLSYQTRLTTFEELAVNEHQRIAFPYCCSKYGKQKKAWLSAVDYCVALSSLSSTKRARQT